MSGFVLAFPQGEASPGPREPSQVPVIHALFVAALIQDCLSTHILGIIAARADPPVPGATSIAGIENSNPRCPVRTRSRAGLTNGSIEE